MSSLQVWRQSSKLPGMLERLSPGMTRCVEWIICLATTVVALLMFALGGDLSSATGAGTEPHQPWVKRGVILAPGFGGILSKDRVSTPCVVHLRNGRVRLSFLGRAE